MGENGKPQGRTRGVNVYDYRSIADGKAIPYGIYDLVHNKGFVNVGIDHETAEFAVESIRRWWQNIGKELYPTGKELLIIADGGGSNGARNRLWKMQLQQFATQSGLSITVCHLPPATSKWNKIEHRLFSYISINWRGKPLTSFETVIELISHTTTKQGLTVTAVKDSNRYPTGIPRLRRRPGFTQHHEGAVSWRLELYHSTTVTGTFISVSALRNETLTWVILLIILLNHPHFNPIHTHTNR